MSCTCVRTPAPRQGKGSSLESGYGYRGGWSCTVMKAAAHGPLIPHSCRSSSAGWGWQNLKLEQLRPN